MKLLFLTYQNRSGSTFLANELSKHPDILVCPEAEILTKLFLSKAKKQIGLNKSIINQLNTDSKFKFWEINTGKLQSNQGLQLFVDVIIEYKNLHKPNASIIVFKGDQILKFYYDIRNANKDKYDISFISLIRDSRAVFLSQKSTKGTWGIEMNTNPISSAIVWNNFSSKSRCANSYSNDFNIIRYEDLVNDFENTIAFIFKDILRLERNIDLQKSGDLLKRTPQNQLSMHENVDKNPISENVSKWKNQLSQQEICFVEMFSKHELLNHGYELENNKFRFSYIVSFVMFYFKYLIEIIKK